MEYRSAKVKTGIEISYATTGDPSHPCVVLIHGYPQTSYMYRHVLTALASHHLYVVAPDYRGAGKSECTESGYDKWTMGADIHSLYKDVLGKSKAIIVGIDIGSMVATALALRFREDVIGLYASECPQPGTFLYDKSTTDDAFKYELVYHFFFHMAPDNWAENLTVGKEKYYINSFYKRLTSKPDFLSGDDLEVYTKAFTGYDRMRAGFEVYRAFLQDRDDVRDDIKQNGKLGANVPVLASGGTKSKFTEYTEEMMSELAENVKHVAVEDSGHWIPEEAPENFVKVLTDWIKNDLKQI